MNSQQKGFFLGIPLVSVFGWTRIIEGVLSFSFQVKKCLVLPIFRLSTVSCLIFAAALPIYATTFPLLSDDDVVGQVYHVKIQKGDTLIKIGNQYDIGQREMRAANPHVNEYRLKIGQSIIVPQRFILPSVEYREGVVINIPELRLYYFPVGGHEVMTFPVALGRLGWRTPTTVTRVRDKKLDPTWNVPKSIKNYTYRKTGRWLPNTIPPGPDNPLGGHAVYLNRRGYLIHGTNDPSSIGRLVSSGCIRMHNRDIEQLFHHLNPGATVVILNHEYKAGWLGNLLYFESLPPVSHNERPTELNYTSPDRVINQSTLHRRASIDWRKVEKVSHQKTGIPEPIGQQYLE